MYTPKRRRQAKSAKQENSAPGAELDAAGATPMLVGNQPYPLAQEGVYQPNPLAPGYVGTYSPSQPYPPTPMPPLEQPNLPPWHLCGGLVRTYRVDKK